MYLIEFANTKQVTDRAHLNRMLAIGGVSILPIDPPTEAVRVAQKDAHKTAILRDGEWKPFSE